MTGLPNAIQIAVYDALTASADLAALLAEHVDRPGEPAVYDDVPQVADTGRDDVFPFVTLGDDTINDWSTDTTSGGEATITLHVWSRANGRRECKQIQGAIYDALHRQELATPDHTFIGCDFDMAETLLDPDGQTRHGPIRFRLFLDRG